jgi:uncharacterized membrane protein
MAFCANCGAQVQGRFCAKCGATVDAAAPPPGAGAGPQAANYPPPPPPLAAGAPLANNVAAALCYALGLVTGILFLVLEPYSRNRAIRFHAFQSIFLHVAAIIVYFVFAMVFMMVRMAGLWFIGLLWPLIGLTFFVIWIYMVVSAYQGKTVVLPVIGPLAQQQA